MEGQYIMRIYSVTVNLIKLVDFKTLSFINNIICKMKINKNMSILITTLIRCKKIILYVIM